MTEDQVVVVEESCEKTTKYKFQSTDPLGVINMESKAIKVMLKCLFPHVDKDDYARVIAVLDGDHGTTQEDVETCEFLSKTAKQVAWCYDNAEVITQNALNCQPALFNAVVERLRFGTNLTELEKIHGIRNVHISRAMSDLSERHLRLLEISELYHKELGRS
ncbi:hypothetical protein [Thaumasiovibrio subtropicus]|uniref:hypothetical protein n=1 Tax=Thaumasiovibrio subtropicus TaxID=1891207 RepID=UPI00131C35F6|nr:hypothetical protein [Thaumasiovibrio subtropicus]